MSSNKNVAVSLFHSGTRKTQLLSLPRDMTVAALQERVGGEALTAFALVDGCSPAPATTMGDLYDYCAAKEKEKEKEKGLEVPARMKIKMTMTTAGKQTRMGAFFCCGPLCVKTEPTAPRADEVITTTTPGQLYNDSPGLTTGGTTGGASGIPNIPGLGGLTG